MYLLRLLTLVACINTLHLSIDESKEHDGLERNEVVNELSRQPRILFTTAFAIVSAVISAVGMISSTVQTQVHGDTLAELQQTAAEAEAFRHEQTYTQLNKLKDSVETLSAKTEFVADMIVQNNEQIVASLHIIRDQELFGEIQSLVQSHVNPLFTAIQQYGSTVEDRENVKFQTAVEHLSNHLRNQINNGDFSLQKFYTLLDDWVTNRSTQFKGPETWYSLRNDAYVYAAMLSYIEEVIDTEHTGYEHFTTVKGLYMLSIAQRLSTYGTPDPEGGPRNCYNKYGPLLYNECGELVCGPEEDVIINWETDDHSGNEGNLGFKVIDNNLIEHYGRAPTMASRGVYGNGYQTYSPNEQSIKVYTDSNDGWFGSFTVTQGGKEQLYRCIDCTPDSRTTKLSNIYLDKDMNGNRDRGGTSNCQQACTFEKMSTSKPVFEWKVQDKKDEDAAGTFGFIAFDEHMIELYKRLPTMTKLGESDLVELPLNVHYLQINTDSTNGFLGELSVTMGGQKQIYFCLTCATDSDTKVLSNIYLDQSLNGKRDRVNHSNCEGSCLFERVSTAVTNFKDKWYFPKNEVPDQCYIRCNGGGRCPWCGTNAFCCSGNKNQKHQNGDCPVDAVEHLKKARRPNDDHICIEEIDYCEVGTSAL